MKKTSRHNTHYTPNFPDTDWQLFLTLNQVGHALAKQQNKQRDAQHLSDSRASDRAE